MGEEPALLDDVAHVTAQVWPFELLGRCPVDVDDAAARIVEAVDQLEQRRLTAAGGTDEDDKLARLDRQGNVDDGGTCLLPVVKPLTDVVKPDLGRGARRAGKCLPLLLDGAPPLRETARRPDGKSATGGVAYVAHPDAVRAATLLSTYDSTCRLAVLPSQSLSRRADPAPRGTRGRRQSAPSCPDRPPASSAPTWPGPSLAAPPGSVHRRSPDSRSASRCGRPAPRDTAARGPYRPRAARDPFQRPDHQCRRRARPVPGLLPAPGSECPAPR